MFGMSWLALVTLVCNVLITIHNLKTPHLHSSCLYLQENRDLCSIRAVVAYSGKDGWGFKRFANIQGRPDSSQMINEDPGRSCCSFSPCSGYSFVPGSSAESTPEQVLSSA
ncbi:hypothetical protein CDAR_554031 [Caerostris darwini]|uniref:Uncharacterized protein n=1 Tax=Caerostris darwini TaxID=1538125 RepID=A0AAV4X7I1_9ARAC|nr:hypothetical protein CDAR_554031 [Caerostris darwini]